MLTAMQARPAAAAAHPGWRPQSGPGNARSLIKGSATVAHPDRVRPASLAGARLRAGQNARTVAARSGRSRFRVLRPFDRCPYLLVAAKTGRRPEERPPHLDHPIRGLYAPETGNGGSRHEAAAAALHESPVSRLSESVPSGAGIRPFRAGAVSTGCRLVSAGSGAKPDHGRGARPGAGTRRDAAGRVGPRPRPLCPDQRRGVLSASTRRETGWPGPNCNCLREVSERIPRRQRPPGDRRPPEGGKGPPPEPNPRAPAAGSPAAVPRRNQRPDALLGGRPHPRPAGPHGESQAGDPHPDVSIARGQPALLRSQNRGWPWCWR